MSVFLSADSHPCFSAQLLIFFNYLNLIVILVLPSYFQSAYMSWQYSVVASWVSYSQPDCLAYMHVSKDKSAITDATAVGVGHSLVCSLVGLILRDHVFPAKSVKFYMIHRKIFVLYMLWSPDLISQFISYCIFCSF